MNGLRIKVWPFIFGICLLNQHLKAQPANMPLTRDAALGVNMALGTENLFFHSNIRPYLLSDFRKFAPDTSRKADEPLESLIMRVTSRKINKGTITLNPVYSLLYGYDGVQKESVSQTSAGFRIRAGAGKKFYGEFKFEALNTNFPAYVDSVIALRKAVPGGDFAGRTALGYSSHMNYGYLSYTPSTFLHLQLGYGRNIFGDGYRSLLLSDNAYSYPYARATAQVWRFKYVSMLANFKDIRTDPGNPDLYINKFASMHYLSWNALPWLNLSLFESIVYQSRRSFNYQSFEVNYLNPLIFYRPVEYSLGSGDNALLGSSLKIVPVKNVHLYGQVILDEFFLKEIRARNGWQDNKQGVQAGCKYFHAFTIKNLSLMMEANMVRPYTYYHKNSLQNYGHYNQPLAHPYGANFSEYIGIATYRYKHLFFAGKLIAAEIGLDPSDTISYGQDLYKSHTLRPAVYGNSIGQGNKATLVSATCKAVYYISYNNNLRLEAALTLRKLRHASGSQDAAIFTLGIVTLLDNRYLDF